MNSLSRGLSFSFTYLNVLGLDNSLWQSSGKNYIFHCWCSSKLTGCLSRKYILPVAFAEPFSTFCPCMMQVLLLLLFPSQRLYTLHSFYLCVPDSLLYFTVTWLTCVTIMGGFDFSKQLGSHASANLEDGQPIKIYKPFLSVTQRLWNRLAPSSACLAELL